VNVGCFERNQPSFVPIRYNDRDIRVLAGDGKPARELPLKEGYFETVLPRAFFQGNPRSIALSWIDFYRN